MTRAVNDATLTKAGDIYQYLNALKDCFDKTRDRIREDTVLINYLLYCPKCKQETLIEAKNLKIAVIKEPDTQMQSR